MGHTSGIPINLAIMNELNDRVTSANTQDLTPQSSQTYAQPAAPTSTRVRSSEPETGPRPSPPEAPVAEQVPEIVVTAEGRGPETTLLFTSRGLESVEHNAAPGAEGKRIFLPPPIPGFIAGTANVGMYTLLYIKKRIWDPCGAVVGGAPPMHISCAGGGVN